MRMPAKYSAEQLSKWDVTRADLESGRWVPARAHKHGVINCMKTRIVLTWAVFTGKFDVVDWKEDEE